MSTNIGTSERKMVGFKVDAGIHTGMKVDAARWDSCVGWIVEGLLTEYLAKPDSERERFVRSLG